MGIKKLLTVVGLLLLVGCDQEPPRPYVLTLAEGFDPTVVAASLDWLRDRGVDCIAVESVDQPRTFDQEVQRVSVTFEDLYKPEEGTYTAGRAYLEGARIEIDPGFKDNAVNLTHEIMHYVLQTQEHDPYGPLARGWDGSFVDPPVETLDQMAEACVGREWLP